MNTSTILYLLGVAVVLCPTMLVVGLGLPLLFGRPLTESTQTRLAKGCAYLGLTSAVAILITMLITGIREVPIEFGNWVEVHEEGFHFHLKLVFDRLSVPFAILSYVLCGTAGAFANIYLQGDRGYDRFFILYAFFMLGIIVSTVAGTIETLFFGWELVGLSSALLVAYFHERPGPVRNGLRIWSIYRFSDAAFLVAALLLHHLTGKGDFDILMGEGTWPNGTAVITSWQALPVGLLLLLAAAGKSGMVPFSGWLPRAMEGPTPSSAVFYGALSIHLGTYLLLRISPLLNASPTLSFAVVVLGAISAISGSLMARVQNDVKNSLAYASLTQIGVITVEIGLGLRYIALIHMIGHACLRTLQLLRAPSFLHDHKAMENAVGIRLNTNDCAVPKTTSPLQLVVYRFAYERGYLDTLIDSFLVQPFVKLFRFFNECERSWTEALSGTKPDEQRQPSADLELVEEMV
ncbi:NADH-quinone oxidoreductase subunit 12 [Thalassoglobus neptunius]|uniref:NADH-quinone oxidoreductase subunit 12 n=1 Tax=Thalassoglobus neptunius TaxID=1938619 RepID=A0A5C5WB37_9PLAN|nr:proton-conducting transporter membrane subunit [Thalassoglobus neptunius]TWT47890.1 NADH-quinone oxidoreductase subunit 12 [Thalassoglobus neptunius]